METTIPLEKEAVDAIQILKDDPEEAKARYALNSSFWRSMAKWVNEGAGGGKNDELRLDVDHNLVDFGMVDEDLVDPESQSLKKMEGARENRPTLPCVEILYFSEWLCNQYKVLLNFDKREDLARNIEFQDREGDRLRTQIHNLQNARVNLYSSTASKLGTGGDILSHLSDWETTDELYERSQRRKKAISRGVFMSLEKKREHIQHEKELEKMQSKCRSMLLELKADAAVSNIEAISKRINDTVAAIIASEEKKRQMEDKLSKLTDELAKLTPAEVENRLTEEVDYLRDMVRLSANRLRSEPMSPLMGNCDLITHEDVARVMERVDEFDPLLFKNARFAIAGPPRVVIVPGKGNGLYDWKNNALIIPTVPYCGIDHSLVSAIVEYRIDVDEEKKMMNSYQQIKEHSGIKSVWALRQKFMKDYTVWMTSEYSGYKVLKKDVRAWFEHDIGPSKNEIIMPVTFAPFFQSKDEYDEMSKSLRKKAEDGDPSPDDWYRLGVVEARDENWGKAVECFQNCVEKNQDHRFGLYNLALTCRKNGMKTDGIAHFNRFVRKYPSSWWAGVARDHLMAMR